MTESTSRADRADAAVQLVAEAEAIEFVFVSDRYGNDAVNDAIRDGRLVSTRKRVSDGVAASFLTLGDAA